MSPPVISLIGPRRIGKTSLLLTLSEQQSTRCKYVYIDLQGLTRVDDVESLLFAVAKQVERACGTENGNLNNLRIKSANPESFSTIDFHSVHRALG